MKNLIIKTSDIDRINNPIAVLFCPYREKVAQRLLTKQLRAVFRKLRSIKNVVFIDIINFYCRFVCCSQINMKKSQASNT